MKFTPPSPSPPLQVVKLAGLEEFQKQKEEMMSNMESLEKQLTSQKEKHKADVHSLEMKALLEQKRLRKGHLDLVKVVN